MWDRTDLRVSPVAPWLESDLGWGFSLCGFTRGVRSPASAVEEAEGHHHLALLVRQMLGD